ncbi:zinc finger CCHC domain-containing protein 7-like [Dreissena polymorpha]|uniref:zinc finger CCHC domain-containing protein 7-like n=1 Tax=Dreissena polymorpha TaxID=45954 RepID=UPI0022647FC1|nr:zinc finger CCHC domain-containing protein 7-like [Dreissena polymorpha]
MEEDRHGDEHSGMDELDYSQEDIEFALYSQIHFESNPDASNISSYAEVENKDFIVNSFTYDVIGEKSSGFVSLPTTVDTILQKCVREKYDTGAVSDDAIELCFVNRKNKVNSNAIKKRNNEDKANKDRENMTCKGSKCVEILSKTKSDNFAEESKLGHRKHKKKVGSAYGAKTRTDFNKSNHAHVIFVSSSESTSSDSDDIYGILGELSENDSNLEMNVEQTDLFAETRNEDKWAISTADSHSAQLKGGVKGRYFKEGLRCYNCNQVGHLSKNCPQPKKMPVCSLCSDSEHTSRTCPNIFCYNCEEPGHDLRGCKAPRRLNMVCFRCNMNGHDQKKCPDVWRQFHVTTESGKLQQPDSRRKRKIALSCYNCGETKHLGHECREERSNKFMRVSTPFVCRYQMDQGFDDMSGRNEGWEEMGSKRRRQNDAPQHKRFSSPNRDEFNTAMEKDSGKSNLRLYELRKLRSLDGDTDLPRSLNNKEKFDNRSKHLERSVPSNESTSCIDNYPIEMESGHIGPESKRFKTGYCGDKLEKFKTALQSTMQRVPEFVPLRKEKMLPEFISCKKQKLPEFISFKKGRSSNLGGRNNFDNLRITTVNSNMNEIDMKMGKKNKRKTDDNEKKMKIKNKKKQKTNVCAENLKDKESNNVGMGDGENISETVVRTKNVKSKNKRHTSNQDLLNTLGKYYDEGIQNKHKKLLNKNVPKSSTFTEVDFPRSALDLSVTFESGDIGQRRSDVRKRNVKVNTNDSSNPDDLFSIQKFHKIKSKLSQGENMSEVQEDGDINHQAFNNEWWNEKKRPKTRIKNIRKKEKAKKRKGMSKSSVTIVTVDIN